MDNKWISNLAIGALLASYALYVEGDDPQPEIHTGNYQPVETPVLDQNVASTDSDTISRR